MTKPLHKYTSGEAKNLQVYNAYAFETMTVDGSVEWRVNGEDVATRGWKMKKVMIIAYSGTGANIMAIRLYQDGSAGASFKFLVDDFPIIIDNIFVDQIQITSVSGPGGDAAVFSVISFGDTD